jgi:hypothetical protein
MSYLCYLCLFAYSAVRHVLTKSVLRYTDSDYPFGIFKLFLPQTCQSLWRHPRHNLNKHLETGRRDLFGVELYVCNFIVFGFFLSERELKFSVNSTFNGIHIQEQEFTGKNIFCYMD